MYLFRYSIIKKPKNIEFPKAGMTESMTSYNAANDACDSNELFEVAFLLFFHDKKFVLKKVSILIKSYSKDICITLRIEIIFPCF